MSLNLRWLFQDIVKQLWFTVALYCVAAVVTALSALVLDPLIPSGMSSKIGADAVDRILGILASSMLAVATFSISTMVQAFASSGSGATPRATQLVVEDRTAQQALATFIGAFVFSLVGLIALSTGAYGPSGRLVLFIVTIGVVVLIVVMLLRWIHRLSRLGRLGETVDQVEAATLKAIQEQRRYPYLDAQAAIAVSPGAIAVGAGKVGYVTRIDMAKLSSLAEMLKADIHVNVLPGAFMFLHRTLAFIDGRVDDDARAAVAACFLIGDQRSFEQDPRFGLIVLSEVASRALSPAVNDPGTAIDVIGTLVRLLTAWADRSETDRSDIRYARIYVPALTAEQLVVDAIVPIARDGAALVEVGIRLQKGLAALMRLGDPALADIARAQARQALARAERALTFDDDLARLKAVAEGEV